MLGSQKPPASGFQSRLCDGSGVLGDILGKMLYLRVGRFGVPIHGGEAIRFECLFVRAFAQDDDVVGVIEGCPGKIQPDIELPAPPRQPAPPTGTEKEHRT